MDWLPDVTFRQSCEDDGLMIATGSTRPNGGSKVLEQRVLESDIVIRAKLIEEEVKIVNTSVVRDLGNSIDSHRYRHWDNYDGYDFTLLHELELQVIEYLSGEGPEVLTAVVESQRIANSEADILCAKRAYEKEVSFNKSESIFFLDDTGDAGQYYLGLAYSIFKGHDPHLWSTQLPGSNEGFYLREKDQWIALDEIRQRVTDVIEEYNQHDDADWRSCVRSKFYSEGRTRGVYRGIHIRLDDLPKQVFNFSGENAPLRAGTTIWEFPNAHDRDLSSWLEGQDAGRFEINFKSDHPFRFNRYGYFAKWEGSELRGLNSVGSANWVAAAEDSLEQRTERYSGHILTTTEDLPQGLYRFNIEWRDNDAYDCGQDREPTEYLVVVTEPGGPSDPPPPPAIRIRDVSKGNITVAWENIPGASKYVLSSISLFDQNDYFKPVTEIQVTNENSSEITWDVDLTALECGVEYGYVVQGRGDGKKYIEDWGLPSDWLVLSPNGVSAQFSPCNGE